jgi:hypothetical protein
LLQQEMFSSSRVGNYRKVIELPAAGRFPYLLQAFSVPYGRLEETRPKGRRWMEVVNCCSHRTGTLALKIGASCTLISGLSNLK